MVRGNHQQLALALGEGDLVLAPTTRTRTRDAGTSSRHSPADTSATGEAARIRAMPSRDTRGRFVSFPTMAAPSWYVFCADGYRIPGETPSDAIARAAPTEIQPLPRAVARSRHVARTRVTRADLLTYLVFVVGYIALFWYGLHLPRPNR